MYHIFSKLEVQFWSKHMNPWSNFSKIKCIFENKNVETFLETEVQFWSKHMNPWPNFSKIKCIFENKNVETFLENGSAILLETHEPLGKFFEN